MPDLSNIEYDSLKPSLTYNFSIRPCWTRSTPITLTSLKFKKVNKTEATATNRRNNVDNQSFQIHFQNSERLYQYQ